VLVRAAAALHAEDDDFGQAGTLYREVYDDAAKARFLETLTGQGSSITVPEIRERFFRYWSTVDTALGASLRQSVAVPAESGDAAAEPVGVSNLNE
jgi:catalase